MNWKSIDTSPQNGGGLIYYNDDVWPCLFIKGKCYVTSFTGGNLYTVKPLYWMPLPEPPK